MKHMSARAGFTIVEVLLAMLIMGLMFTSITQLMAAAQSTRDSVHNMQESQMAGPAILDLMEQDLRAMMTVGLPRASWLRVRDKVVGGLDADRIDFLTTTDSLIARIEDQESPKRSDYNEVGYMLRPNPRNDEFLEVYRREDFGIDDEPFEGGEYTFLADQPKSFDIQVYAEDGPDVDPLDDWDSGADDEERSGLPAALELRITIELKPRIDRESLDLASLRRRTVTYTRWIRLDEGLRFPAGQFPRLGLPAGPSSGTPGAAGAGGTGGTGEGAAGAGAGGAGAGAGGAGAGAGAGGRGAAGAGQDPGGATKRDG